MVQTIYVREIKPSYITTTTKANKTNETLPGIIASAHHTASANSGTNKLH